MRRPFRLLVSLTALAVAATTAFAAAPAFADSLGNGVLNLVKAASTANPEPGTTFSYTINFGCSSTTTGCVDATITDPVPAPLTIVGTPTVVGAGTSDVSVSGNTVTVAFKDAVPNTVPPSIGLAAGTTGTVTVQVKVPDDLPKSSDGQVATNTATFTATNATTKTADAPVTFRVPSVIAETVTKSWDPSSTQYQPNATSTVSLTAQNTSNIPASSMSITEPADPADAAGVFAFYNLASLGTVTFPQGADRVQVIATVNGAPINGPPSETATLPDGVDPASVTALQFVFTSSTGAPIAAGGSAGGVDLTVAQRSTNRSTGDALVNGGTRTNQAGGHIVTADGPADAPPATAQQVVSPLTATVGASKKFATTEIPAGESTSAVITAENTSTGPLDTLSVAEPGAGSFFTADVGFAGFDNAQSAWPAGATSAHVEWTVNTGSTPSDSPFTETSGLPETPALSAGQYIIGFKIVYKGAVASGSEAKIEVKVSTTTSAGPAAAASPRTPTRQRSPAATPPAPRQRTAPMNCGSTTPRST